MHHYFHGWRRKLGVVTLVMACVFMAGWVRSITYQDLFTIPTGNQSLEMIESSNHTIIFVRFSGFAYNIPMGVESHRWSPESQLDLTFRLKQPGARGWQIFGFGVVADGATGPGVATSAAYYVPYWSIVVPLTLLPVYLLLVKPRPTTSPTEST